MCKRDGRVKDISIVFCYVINSVCAVVREDSGTFAFRPTDIANEKNLRKKLGRVGRRTTENAECTERLHMGFFYVLLRHLRFKNKYKPTKVLTY